MKKFLALFTLTLGFFISFGSAHASFTDVNPSHPYFKAISYLEQQGVVEGYDDGTYRPNDFISRVEALKIILEGSGIAVNETQNDAGFIDVAATSWYAKYVNQAKAMGIVSGDADTGLFRPGDQTKLAENLKILLEAADRKVEKPNSNPYLDVPATAWFGPYFGYAKTLALFPQSSRENIQPGNPITRGMMADLMYQLTFKPEGYQEGEASYYGLNLQGNGTASGERFDAYGLTAAHPTLPFGTLLKVKNIANGKEVTVKVNDRGPYTGGRIIDLSQAAFEVIAPLSQGVAHVSIVPANAEIKSTPTGTNCEDKSGMAYLSKTTFKDITLDQEIPNRFLNNEVLTLSGTLSGGQKEVSAFLVDASNKQFPFYAPANDLGKFEVQLFFPASGTYQLGLVPGNAGTSPVQTLKVIPSSCQDTALDKDLKMLTGLEANLTKGNLELSWGDDQNYEVKKITFTQGEKKKDYILYAKDQFFPHYADFEGWEEGLVEVQVQGGHLNKNSILEVSSLRWSPPAKLTFNAELHRDYTLDKAKVKLLSLPHHLQSNTPVTIEVDPLVNLNEKALIIVPQGQVESSLMTSKTHNALVNPNGVRILPSGASEVSFSYLPQGNQTYVFEINDEEGQAVLNLALYPEGHYPLLPNPNDKANLKDSELDQSVTLLRSYMLNLVNQDRAQNGLSPLKLDSKLSDLAQLKTDDMAKRDYLSHWNPEGLTLNQLRKDFGIKPFVSENIALDATPFLAEYGLMSSAAHRMNILKEEWKLVGFGISKSPKGGYLFVQTFSDAPVNFSNVGELRTQVINGLNKGRNTSLLSNENLNVVSQQWSEKMVAEDFFGITSPGNVKLVDIIRDTGVKETLGTYLVGNSSFDSALDQILSNPALKDGNWKKVGVGIAQDAEGIIKFTLSYTE